MYFFQKSRRQKTVKSAKKIKADESILASNTTKAISISAAVSASNKYEKEFYKLKKTIPCWDEFFSVLEEERLDIWPRLEVLGNVLCEKFSWAIPDQRALNILTHFRYIYLYASKSYIQLCRY